jgi:hypothetical protein
MPDKPLLPILPESGVYLTSLGQYDERRFAGLFRCAWQRIPLGARQLMLKHWQEGKREKVA